MPTAKNNTTRNKKPVQKRRDTSRRSKVKHDIAPWKFLPAILIASLAMFLSWQPQLQQFNSAKRGVLAYATNMSVGGLLTATNNQRSAFGVSVLSLNQTLNSAAQAKANDMVGRNYWSHNTPDGQEPWIFFSQAGYNYSAAGENLAYGFMTSGDAVIGWMNSPTHKANLISSAYTEVGFGIANSINFVGDGEQTVVVAMYGKPQVAAATTQPAPAAPAPQPAAAPVPKASVEPAATAPDVTPAPKETPLSEAEKDNELITTASLETAPPTAAPVETTRLQLIGVLNPVLSTSLVVLAVLATGALWLLHKGFHLRRYLIAGEHFIHKHWHLDLTVLAIIFLGFVLLSGAGMVR